MTNRISLTVNGRTEVLEARATDRLLDLLRRDLRLLSVREACGIGICGSCTVLVDGRPISSCLVLAPFSDGWNIETIEHPDATTRRIQEAFVEHNAFQCSYCTPGFILTVRALLAEVPNPDLDTIKRYLAGNLCRCGSYKKIAEAVLTASARIAAESVSSSPVEPP
jgi:aerobic-type carbon monoxide dehydrogenase small subunit (CoxS/CutS family)